MNLDYLNYLDLQDLANYLIRDEEDSRIKHICDIDDEYTYDAKGVNVDFILYLEKTQDKSYKKEKFNIEKLFLSEFNTIKAYASEKEVDNFSDIVNYLISSPLIDASRDLISQTKEDIFNYCITLYDRYIPRIYINLEQRVHSLLESRNILEQVYENRELEINLEDYEQEFQKTKKLKNLEESYLEARSRLKSELCKYIILWIRAYRYLKARQKLRNQKYIIAFSHRYQGWSNPRHKLNNDLTVEFKTNFGYGNSSFFYLLLIYRGIQIFPFMDWINYQYAQVSRMENYTIEYPNEDTNRDRKESDYKLKNYRVIIYQEDWLTAFDDLTKACNISERSSDEFIKEYITSALDELIAKLEKIYKEDDDVVNKKYRSFDYNFSVHTLHEFEKYTKKIKLINVKGNIISGTLSFMGQVTKLNEIIDSEIYVKKIESLNKKLIPILEETIPGCHELISELEKEIEQYRADISYVWLDLGLKDYDYNKNNYLEVQKKGFQELERLYNELLNEKNKKEQDLNHSRNILRSIERYIRNIERYFEKAHN